MKVIFRCFLLVLMTLAATGTSQAKKKPHVVFLISEDPDNYEARKTIPVFAQKLRAANRYEVTVLLGEGTNNAFRFPGMEILKKADLVVLFSRRIALPH